MPCAPCTCRWAAACSTWRAARATCAASSSVHRCDRSASTSRSGCWRPPAPTCRWCRATRCGCPCPMRASTASRAGSRCATSSTSTRSSSSWPGSRDRTVTSHCSRWPSPRPPVALGTRRVLRQGRAAHRRAVLRRQRLSLPAEVGRLPAARGRDALVVARRRVRRGRTPPAVDRDRAAHRGATCERHVSDASAATLHAVTRRLDVEADLLAFAGDDGPLWTRGRSGLAGRGEALRIEVPRVDPTTAAKAVHDALDQIEVDDEVQVPGTGPVALGALPFDVSEPGVVVVPELVLGRADDGTRWLTAITPTGDEPVMPDLVSAPVIEPRSFRVESERAVDDWCADLVALPRGAPRRRGRQGRAGASRAGRGRCPAVAPSDRRAIPRRLSRLHAERHRRLPGCEPRAARGPSRRRGALSPDGRHRAPQRRPQYRCRPGRVAHRVDQGPARASAHDRHGARHPAALVLLHRRGGRALDRRHGQRATPRHARRRTAVESPGVGDRTGHRAAPRRRPSAGRHAAPRSS